MKWKHRRPTADDARESICGTSIDGPIGNEIGSVPNTEFVNDAFLEWGSEGCWRWVVRHCVLCGSTHVHGGDLHERDPRNTLGHRSSFCGIQGYLINDGNPMATAELLRKRGAFR